MTKLGKRFFISCLVLITAGCAPLAPKPPAKPPAPKPAPADVTQPRPESPKPVTSEPGSPVSALPSTVAEKYLMELGEVQAMSVEQSRRELNELTASKRLDKPKRLRLAAVLARDEHGDWDRALKMLDGLANDDPPSQVLVDLLRKTWRTRLELRQQDARVTELQQRIQQIKTLEKDLLQRSETP